MKKYLLTHLFLFLVGGTMKLKQMLIAVALGFSVGLSGLAVAGPVILGGDDLTDHGSRTGGGVNLQGWLYIEKAIANLYSAQNVP